MKNDITKKMLNTIRESIYQNEKENSKPEIPILTESKPMNFLEEANYLMSRTEKKKLNEEEDTDGKTDKEFVITKTTPQFGDIYESQTSAVLKAIGEGVEFNDKALVYYPNINDLTLSGKINSLKIMFQMRYNDPSGEGCYIWANGSQLTDSNLRTIGKIRDAFVNWKQSLIQNADLLDKMKKASGRNDF